MVIRQVVLAKMLHGWLQNRHQTLFPLAVNLRNLGQAGCRTLTEVAAITLLADEAAALRTEQMRAFLRDAGAQADTLSALDVALADPPALSTVIAAVQSQELAPYAYVVALTALGMREGAGGHLLAYLAARFGLPVTIVRSANRKFGR